MARVVTVNSTQHTGGMHTSQHSEALFIGGPSGVGKSTIALEVSHQLAVADISHAVIEGDNLDLAYPEPWRQGLDLAERNFAVVWRNYRQAGYVRLIYTNTVSVLEMPKLTAAMGGDVRSIGVLLTATDETARSRLKARKIGAGLDAHFERSSNAARELDRRTSTSVHRVATDGRRVRDIAEEVSALPRWLGESASSA